MLQVTTHKDHHLFELLRSGEVGRSGSWVPMVELPSFFPVSMSFFRATFGQLSDNFQITLHIFSSECSTWIFDSFDIIDDFVKDHPPQPKSSERGWLWWFPSGLVLWAAIDHTHCHGTEGTITKSFIPGNDISHLWSSWKISIKTATGYDFWDTCDHFLEIL